MTRRELLTACVEYQIAIGVVKPEYKEKQIKWRLNGYGGIEAMSKADCESWYKKVLEKQGGAKK